MTTERDQAGDELMRAIVAADPVARGAVPPRGYELDAVIDEIVAGVPDAASGAPILGASGAPRRRRARTAAAVIGIVGVVVVGGAVAATTLGNQVTNAEAPVYCRADTAVAGGAVVDGGGDPVGACRTAWEQGVVLDGRGETPPELTACVTADGLVEVFAAGRSVCTEVGSSPLGEVPDAALAVGELQDRLVGATLDRCADPAAVGDLATRLVDELGLEGWSVLVRPPATEGPACAGIGVDTEQRLVVVVPLPG